MSVNQTNAKRLVGQARRLRRGLPWLGVVGLVALIIAGLWPRAVPVESGLITAGRLRTTINEEGKTRIRQRYILSAPVAGQLRRIPFKAGAEIERDALVAVIDPIKPALLD